MPERPRIYLHPDNAWLSIGFEGTPDTLLKAPEGWRDRAAFIEWARAVESLLAARGGTEDELRAAAQEVVDAWDHSLRNGLPARAPDCLRAALAARAASTPEEERDGE